MKKSLLKFSLIAAIALVCGMNVYNSQRNNLMSDVALANVEALAQEAESGEQFTEATCCIACDYVSTCKGCDGKSYSYSYRP